MAIHKSAQHKPLTQPTVQKDSNLNVSIGIKWSGQDCRVVDWHFIPNLKLSHDFLPVEIGIKLPGLKTGDSVSHTFAPGELIEDWQPDRLMKIDATAFQPPQNNSFKIRLALGRFYPGDFFKMIHPVDQSNLLPVRIIGINDDVLSVDFNHPLAGKKLELTLRIECISESGEIPDSSYKDITAISCDSGPGMQDRLPDAETDFWSDHPFQRLNSEDDSKLYAQPSLIPFWDSTTLLEMSKLYNQLVPDQARVLDLMAGVHSPLQESAVKASSVTCAGLNQQELNNNPICTQVMVLDVNTIQALPFEDEAFDVVLIHAAIEYVIQPMLLFAEISRVLKPRGRSIISFSNRSVQEKTIKLWLDAHEFERPAIVLSYLRSTGSFGNFHGFSKRGLLRPETDPLADQLLLSDPVYVVWAEKN